ncbi:MAG: outer membrane protein assembly factor BamD [Rhodospirillaceae bacterium]|nr:MAG: outer membrane protein assembly factor BamD [Rhodospirillaceae bacterium]
MSFGLTFRGRKAIALGLGLGAMLLLAACGKDKELEYKEQSVYEIYSQALGYLDDGQYKEAAQYFDEVERQHPYSVWATKAKLMAAYALYQSNKYDDAVSALDRFIAVHPGNRDVVYAYYLKALCYYEQIADVQRDQELTQKALDSLQDVVTRFPGTTYARDARLKIDLTRDHLAGQQMAIGRFYERRVQFLAAINRYKSVVDEYGDTSHSPEALERLTECFVGLGLVGEARKTAAVLGYNYPGSDWYKDAYTKVEGVPPPTPDKMLAQGEAPAPQDAGTSPPSPTAEASAPAQAAPEKPKLPWWKLW